MRANLASTAQSPIQDIQGRYNIIDGCENLCQVIWNRHFRRIRALLGSPSGPRCGILSIVKVLMPQIRNCPTLRNGLYESSTKHQVLNRNVNMMIYMSEMR
jgi:hypothetical protein